MYSDDKLQVGSLTVRLEQDQDASSPREDDNVGMMTCFHRRYTLGDEHSHESNSAFLFSLASEHYADLEDLLDNRMYSRMVTASYDQPEYKTQRKAWDEARDAFIWKAIDKHYVILPLGLYDHSGISMYVGSQPSPFDPGGWDSGQVGWIYVSAEKARKEFGRKWRKRAEECLRAEVKVYDDFITGNVWGFVVEGADGECVDSCWGFVGDVEYAFAEGKSSAEYYLANEAKQEQEVRDTFAL